MVFQAIISILKLFLEMAKVEGYNKDHLSPSCYPPDVPASIYTMPLCKWSKTSFATKLEDAEQFLKERGL